MNVLEAHTSNLLDPNGIHPLGHAAAMAARFGEARGWRVSRSGFRIRDLQGRMKPGNWRFDLHGTAAMFPRTFADHGVCYRDGSRRAAAVLGQPYAADLDRVDALAWAAELGLRITFPDEPSWWFPGRTVLLLIEPTA